MKYEIRLSGKGGQGLVFAGVVLAEAAAVHENFYAVQKQSYGPEARGGASKSDVIISDEEIDYIQVDELDILLAISQEAYDKYSSNLKKDGILIIDESLVSAESPRSDLKLLKFNFTDIARKQFGSEIYANIIGLGVIVGLIGTISEESVKKVLENRLPQNYLSANYQALAKGIELSGRAIGIH